MEHKFRTGKRIERKQTTIYNKIMTSDNLLSQDLIDAAYGDLVDDALTQEGNIVIQLRKGDKQSLESEFYVVSDCINNKIKFFQKQWLECADKNAHSLLINRFLKAIQVQITADGDLALSGDEYEPNIIVSLSQQDNYRQLTINQHGASQTFEVSGIESNKAEDKQPSNQEDELMNQDEIDQLVAQLSNGPVEAPDDSKQLSALTLQENDRIKELENELEELKVQMSYWQKRSKRYEELYHILEQRNSYLKKQFTASKNKE